MSFSTCPTLPSTFSTLSDTEKNRAFDKVLTHALTLSTKTFGLYHCFFDNYSVYRHSNYANARRYFLAPRPTKKESKETSPPKKPKANDTSSPPAEKKSSKYVPPHKRQSSDSQTEKPSQPTKPQEKKVRPRAHPSTPVDPKKKSPLTRDLLTKIDSLLKREANDRDLIPSAIASMFESNSPDTPVFDVLFPGFPRQRLSDSVLRHSGKFTALTKELFHQLLSDLASRLTRKLKLKLTPTHMNLLSKKLSAAVNYKLRKQSNANAKKDRATAKSKDNDAKPSPRPQKPTSRKAKKTKKQSPQKDEISFVPASESQVSALASSKPLADTDPNSEVHISELTKVRDQIKIIQDFEFACQHPVKPYQASVLPNAHGDARLAPLREKLLVPKPVYRTQKAHDQDMEAIRAQISAIESLTFETCLSSAILPMFFENINTLSQYTLSPTLYYIDSSTRELTFGITPFHMSSNPERPAPHTLALNDLLVQERLLRPF